MKRIARGLGVGLCALLAVACSSDELVWQNPNLPESAWAQDKAQCDQLAQQRAEQDFALAQGNSPQTRNNATREWTTQMNQFSAGQRQQELFAQCMTDRGYRQVTPKPKDE